MRKAAVRYWASAMITRFQTLVSRAKETINLFNRKVELMSRCCCDKVTARDASYCDSCCNLESSPLEFYANHGHKIAAGLGIIEVFTIRNGPGKISIREAVGFICGVKNVVQEKAE